MRTLTLPVLRDNFPFPEPRPTQDEALKEISAADGNVILEMPTGSGKTAVGLAALRAHSARGEGPLYYVTPTKTQVDQLERLHKVQKVLGRAEYECLYYEGGKVTAHESPCYMLDCPHRVDQQTGEVEDPEFDPCPYFQAKFEARKHAEAGGIVACTTAFFVTNRMRVTEWREAEPMLVVLDEAHRIAEVTRGVFEYSMTDWHLKRVAEKVKEFDRRTAKLILDFLRAFRRIARKRPSARPALIKEEEIGRLLGILDRIDAKELEKKVRAAVRGGAIDPREQQADLKLLENLVRNIPRFVHSLQYAVAEEDRNALNYVVAFYFREDDPGFAGTQKRARYHLTVKSYYVAPVIRKALGARVIAYSATIGDPEIFGFESGLRKLPFRSFRSDFPPERTRVYLPADTPNLSAKHRRRDDVKKSLKLVAQAAKRFARAGHRSLVVVVSEDERQKFLRKAADAGLTTVTYGNGRKAKEAAAAFVGGEGEALVGTAAHYAEGVDLPRGIAPVIFFLRPGYAPPDDPEAQFEKQRFSEGMCWALWNYRVMMQALQVRGRNVRDAEDVGVCYFISQQFRRFLHGALPEWLKPAYVGDKPMEAAVRETMKLLG